MGIFKVDLTESHARVQHVLDQYALALKRNPGNHMYLNLHLTEIRDATKNWPINTEAFMQQVHKLMLANNVHRAKKLVNVASENSVRKGWWWVIVGLMVLFYTALFAGFIALVIYALRYLGVI